MSNYVFKVELNSKSVSETISKLRNYQNGLSAKIQEFVGRLADIGITVARSSSGGEFEPYLVFKREVTRQQGSVGAKALVIGSNSSLAKVVWDGGEAIVNPILMTEFGSGWKAWNPKGISGVGQGTFPRQKYAFDPKGWWWSENGVTHHSYGTKAYAPMEHALVEMISQVESIAMQVFGKGGNL